MVEGFEFRQGEMEIELLGGASLEWGGAWQGRSEIGLDATLFAGSLFIGADTPIGPLYSAYGRTEGGEQAFYLFLGKPWRIQR